MESLINNDSDPNNIIATNDDAEQNEKSFIETIRKMFQGNDIGRQFWMPDSISKQCYECGLKFTIIRRRHHCRICGQIFCSNCCNEMIDAKLLKIQMNDTENNCFLRVCKHCFKYMMCNAILKNKDSSSRSIDSRNSSQSHDLSLIQSNSETNNSLKKWFKSSLIGRRFSTVTSTTVDNVRSISQSSFYQDNKTTPSNNEIGVDSNPLSPSSSFHRRFSLEHLQIDRENTNLSNSQIFFDNFCTLMAELDKTIDASEPNWVKEILQEVNKNDNFDESEYIKDILQFANDSNLMQNDKSIESNKSNWVDDSEDENETSNLIETDGEEEAKKNIKLYNFKSNSGDAIVRYNPTSSLSSKVSRLEKSIPKDDRLKTYLDSSVYYLYDGQMLHDGSVIENSCSSTDHADSSIRKQSYLEKLGFPMDVQIINSDLPSVLLDAIYDRHSNRILQQILIDEKISLEWLPVLNDIAKRIATTIKTNKNNNFLSCADSYFTNSDENISLEEPDENIESTFNDMDIRKRIKIKTIEYGSKADCCIVNGVVFHKNVAHRQMRTCIDDPRILLFACSIGYDERRRSLTNSSSTIGNLKLTMFDSMRMQEENYISNLVAKISSLKPNVIFVEGSVSQMALELLRKKNITVILNVKFSVLKRIAVLIDCNIIYSPETLVNVVKIGTCAKFYLKEFIISKDKNNLKLNGMSNLNYFYGKRTMVFLESTSDNICSTVILRGSNRFAEFKKLKNILRYMIYVHYNNRLEKAFNQSFSCIPIEEGIWNSMNELFQHVIRVRQRINSSRSISYLNVQESEGSSFDSLPSSESETKFSEKLSKPKLTIIDDHSDPLRAAVNSASNDDTSFYNESNLNMNNNLNTKLNEIIDRADKFEQILSIIPLSSSPCIQFSLPFLMHKNIHEKSSLRFYYPMDLLNSKRLNQEMKAEMASKEVSSDDYNPSDEKDDDYANFLYLLSQKKSNQKGSSSKTQLISKDNPKLSSLCTLLTMRYTVTKNHPLLLNNDHDFKNNSQHFEADFRANGPHLQCIPDFYARMNDYLNESSSLEQNDVSLPTSLEPLSCEEQQQISVLFSLFSLKSENAPNYCFKPQIIDIRFYGKNDMSLGAFLEKHFFYRYHRTAQSDESDSFPSGSPTSKKIFCSNEACTVSMFKHFMRFTHHNGTVTVILNKIQDSGHVALPNKVLTWTFCVQCRHKSSHTQMSYDALSLSFGKFLELKFYGNRHFNYQKYFPAKVGEDDAAKETNVCQHSLHKESYQFFSFGQLVVSFKYEPIVIYEIFSPTNVIPITRNHFSKTKIINELKDLTMQCHDVYSIISHEIEKIKLSSINKGQLTNPVLANLNIDQNDLALLEDFLQLIQQEEDEVAKSVKEIHFRISLPDLDNFNVAQLFRIQNSVTRIKKSMAKAVAAWNDRINEFVASHKRNPDKLLTSFMNRLLPNDSKQENKTPDNVSNLNLEINDSSSIDTVMTFSPANDDATSHKESFSIEVEANNNNVQVNSGSLVTGNTDKSTTNKLSSITSKVMSKVSANRMNSNENETLTASGTSSFASRFLTRVNEENYINIEMPFDCSNLPKQHQMFEHYQLPTYKDISIIVRDKDPGSMIAYALTTPEYEQKLSDIKSKNVDASINQIDSSGNNGEIMNSDQVLAGSNKPIDSVDGNKSSSTDNPSQHIDIQYSDSFGKFYCCIYFAKQFQRFRSFVLTDGGKSNRDTIRQSTNSNVANAFIEDLYIHSLANCLPWNAVGGKSGSTFSKTQNQRFILKGVLKGELKHFLTFVSDYINYCERACQNKLPSALVKVIGVYKIIYKNTFTNKGSYHYIFVMENLFYECNVSFIYDLKGSMRNRKVEINSTISKTGTESKVDSSTANNNVDQQSTSNFPQNSSQSVESAKENNETNSVSTVLLDENLRQISTVYPLYVHEHSKIYLMDAIFRDSEFLRNHGVMDYSLLVGFDDEHNEYVAGIIDYVRLFNWEKILEFGVKKLGNAIDPTIVNPTSYQRRFIDAINSYFTEVPDKWHPFLKLIPAEPTLLPNIIANKQPESNTGANVSVPDNETNGEKIPNNLTK